MHRSYDGDIADERWKRAIGLAKRAVEAGCDLTVTPFVEEEEEVKSTWLGSPSPLSQGATLAQQLSAAAAASRPSPTPATLAQRLSAAAAASRPSPTPAGPPGLFAPPPAKKQEMLRPSSLVSPPAARKKYLILLDMNGTLLVRTKQRFPRPPSAVLHEVMYYFRNYAVDFVEELTANESVEVAFYTSMKASSAKPAVSALCRRRRAEVYPREFNKDDPSGTNSWDTMRDLEKIWSTPGRAGHGFDETNTIVVEDTARKMREHPHNVVVVPTYTENSVLRNDDDDALRQLSLFLKNLFAAQTPDVRTYLQAKPFACEESSFSMLYPATNFSDEEETRARKLQPAYYPVSSKTPHSASSSAKKNRSPKPSPHQRRDHQRN